MLLTSRHRLLPVGILRWQREHVQLNYLPSKFRFYFLYYSQLKRFYMTYIWCQFRQGPIRKIKSKSVKPQVGLSNRVGHALACIWSYTVWLWFINIFFHSPSVESINDGSFAKTMYICIFLNRLNEQHIIKNATGNRIWLLQ